MQPRIVNGIERKLIGTRMKMSFANNMTGELWKVFMQKRSEIINIVKSDLISLQIYQPNHFIDFNPTREFEKWAAAEVIDLSSIPAGFESFKLPGGLYAVFDYKGSSNDLSIFHYIFNTWLPSSDYLLDDRPHFEILGEKYRNADPNSEEEIWIPIRKKLN